ncbi:MAG: hypothetical protein ACXVLT_00555 [Flavisolibacter sp.]
MSRYLSFASLFLLLFIVSCQKEKSFEQGTPSKGSLQGAFGDCLSKTVTGTYIATKSLTDSNYIDVSVDITQAGHYSIYTDTVNGYFFRASGTFTTVGSNTVRMKAFGTPGTAGTNDFTVFYDSTVCAVSVTVLPVGSSGGGGTTSTDHFILTDNSWWSYSSPLPTDTIKRNILPGTFTTSGFAYKGMKELDAAGQFFDDTLFYRKSGSNYYELNYVDTYTSIFLDNPGVDSLLFLKEGLTNGATWSSPVYTGTDSGAVRKIRYDYTCTNNNATVTLNSKTFTNVYQVTTKVMLDSGSGFVTDVTYTRYYAQSVGMVYEKVDYGGGQTYEFTIKNYQVF